MDIVQRLTGEEGLVRRHAESRGGCHAPLASLLVMTMLICGGGCSGGSPGEEEAPKGDERVSVYGVSGWVTAMPNAAGALPASAGDARVELLVEELFEGDVVVLERHEVALDGDGAFGLRLDRDQSEGGGLAVRLLARLDGHAPFSLPLWLGGADGVRVEIALFEYAVIEPEGELSLSDGSLIVGRLPSEAARALALTFDPALHGDVLQGGYRHQGGWSPLSFAAAAELRLIGADGEESLDLEEPVSLRVEVPRSSWEGLTVLPPDFAMEPGVPLHPDALVDATRASELSSESLDAVVRIPLFRFQEDTGWWSFESVGRLESAGGAAVRYGELAGLWSKEHAARLYARGDVPGTARWGQAWPVALSCVRGIVRRELEGEDSAAAVAGLTVVGIGEGDDQRAGPVVTDEEGRFCLPARPSSSLRVYARRPEGHSFLGQVSVESEPSSSFECSESTCQDLGTLLLEKVTDDGSATPCFVVVETKLGSHANLLPGLSPPDISVARVDARVSAASMRWVTEACRKADDCLHANSASDGLATVLLPKGEIPVRLAASLEHRVIGEHRDGDLFYSWRGGRLLHDVVCLDDPESVPPPKEAGVSLSLVPTRGSLDDLGLAVQWLDSEGLLGTPRVKWEPRGVDGLPMDLGTGLHLARLVVTAGTGDAEEVLWEIAATDDLDWGGEPGLPSPLELLDYLDEPAVKQVVAPAALASPEAYPAARAEVAVLGERGGVLWTGRGDTAWFSGAPAHSTSSLSIEGDHAVADGETAVAVTVMVRDVVGEPVPNARVDVSILGSDSDVTEPVAGLTDAAGVFQTHVSSTLAEQKEIVARVADAFSLEDTAVFVPGQVCGNTSTLEADKTIAVADGEDSIGLLVRALDSQGNPVPGLELEWSVTGAAHDLQAAHVTDDVGEAEATLSSATVGSRIVAVEFSGQRLDLEVQFQPAPPFALEILSGDPQSQPVTETLYEPFVARLSDENGHPIAGWEVVFQVFEIPDGAVSQALSNAVSVTDERGVVSTVLTLGTRSGVYLVRASAQGYQEGPVATFVATALPGDPFVIARVSGGGQVQPVTSTLAHPFKVRAQDEHGNGVPDHLISFIFETYPEGASSHELTAAGVRTGVDGVAETSLVLGERAGRYRVRATGSEGLSGNHVSFEARAVPGDAWSLEPVSGDGQTQIVGEALDEPFTIGVFDAHGNPIAGHRISFTVTGAPNEAQGQILLDDAVTTDEEGLAKASLILGDKAGGYQVTAASQEPLAGSPAVFNALATPAQPHALRYVAGDGQSEMVTETLQPFEVRVEDEHGNAVGGHPVEVQIEQVPEDATGYSWSSSSGVTDSSGLFSTTLTLGDKVGTYRVSARAEGLHGSPVVFASTATHGPASRISQLAGGDQSGRVTERLDSPLIVRVFDQYDNAVPGETVGFAVETHPHEAVGQELTDESVSTDSGGVAGTSLILGSRTGEYIVRAWLKNMSEVPSVHFIATALPGEARSLVEVSGDEQTGVVASVLQEPFVLLVLDEHGNAVTDEEIYFSVTAVPQDALEHELSSTLVLADELGLAHTTLTLGTIAGTYQITAAGAEGSSIPEVVFTAFALAGEAESIELVSGDDQAGAVTTGLEPLVVRVVDRYGNAIDDHEVTFETVSAPEGAEGHALSQVTGSTDADGLASTNLTLGDKVGPYVVNAGGETELAGSPVIFTASATAGPAHELLVASGDLQTGRVGLQLADPFVVRVLDEHGNPVPEHTVTFEIGAKPSGAVGLELSVSAAITDTDGLASTVLTLGSRMGRYSVTATGDDALLDRPVEIEALAEPGDPHALDKLFGDGQEGRVGESLSEFVVRVRDELGNPIQEHWVEFAITKAPSASSGQQLSRLHVETDAEGIATSALTLGSRTGLYEIRVSASGTLHGSPSHFEVTALHGEPNAIQQLSGGWQEAAVGTVLEPFVVRIVDRFDNGVPGHAVAFAIAQAPAGSVGHELSVLSTLTDSEGVAQTSLTFGSKSGSFSVSATAAAEIEGSPSSFFATARPGAIADLQLVSGQGQSARVTTTLAPFVVRVIDDHGNVVPGQTVSFAIHAVPDGAEGHTLSTTLVSTDSEGLGRTVLTLGTAAGSYEVGASSPSLEGSAVAFLAQGTAGPPSLVEKVAGDDQESRVTTSLLPFLVRVLDSHGNPVRGLRVDFAITEAPAGAGGQSLNVSSVTTDSGGRAGTILTLGDKVGSYGVTVAAAGVSAVVVYRAQAKPGTAYAFTHVSGDDQTAGVGTELEPMRVRVVDEHGNGVPEVPVTFGIVLDPPPPASDASLDLALTATDSSGHAQSRLTLGTRPGEYRVVAGTAQLGGASVVFEATAQPGPAFELRNVSGDGQSAPVTWQLPQPYVVRVVDAFGNAAPEHLVFYDLVTMPAGSVGQELTTLMDITDHEGFSSTHLTHGTLPGDYEVRATTSGSLIGSPLVFMSTAEECIPDCVGRECGGDGCGGGCGICGAQEVCQTGQCLDECDVGMTECEGICVDLESDDENCGACGHQCIGYQVCEAGACLLSCPPDKMECDGYCHPTVSNSCQTAWALGELSSGAAVSSLTALLPAPGQEHWYDLSFPPDWMPGWALRGEGRAEVGLARNDEGEFRILVCDEGCSNCYPLGTNWTFEDSCQGMGDTFLQGCNTRLMDWPENVRVRVSRAAGDTASCGSYRLAARRGEAMEPLCPEGQTDCDLKCVDTGTDPEHCGECFSGCQQGFACDLGECYEPCPPGTGEHPSQTGDCLASVVVPCRDESPDNAAPTSTNVRVYWIEYEQTWTDNVCQWACLPGFGEHDTRPGECLDQLTVDARPEPPVNGYCVGSTVTLHWQEESGQWSSDQCPWECDRCYFAYGNVCRRYTVFPDRTWHGNPYGLHAEVLGNEFDADTLLIWDAGGNEVAISPGVVESDRLLVTLEPALLTASVGVVPLAVRHGDGERCPTEAPFRIGTGLPDTGQTLCHDASTTIPCPPAGEQFYGQDAQFGWDTLLTPADRFQRSGVSQPVVLDRITRLHWQGCVAGLSGSTCGSGEELRHSLANARSYCNGLSWGGYSDWALPTPLELAGILDHGGSADRIYQAFFPATPTLSHWSAPGSSGSAYLVSFSTGAMSRSTSTASSLSVRCVRRTAGAHQPSFSRSILVPGEPIVRDHATGLVWQGCWQGQQGDSCEGFGTLVAWNEALQACADSEWGGYADWRLPSGNELLSILSFTTTWPSLSSLHFPGQRTNAWSSTTARSFSQAMRVNVGLDSVTVSTGKTSAFGVRCVRDGP